MQLNENMRTLVLGVTFLRKPERWLEIFNQLRNRKERQIQRLTELSMFQSHSSLTPYGSPNTEPICAFVLGASLEY